MVSSKLWVFAVIPILAIPFENQYRVFGFSLGKLTILPLFLIVILFYARRFFSMWNHPIFLSGMGFLVWSVLAEALHPFSEWEFHYRIFQMFVFASLVATVSSNPVIFRYLLLAVPFVSSLLGFYLVYNFYALVNADVASFKEGSQVRAESFEEMSLAENLNVLAYGVGMGGVVGLAKLLVVRGYWQRRIWVGIYLLCTVGSFVPASRGACVAVVAASAMVLWRNMRGAITTRKVLLGVSAVVLAFFLMPGALTSRFASLKTDDVGIIAEEDSRAKVYGPALEAISQYWAVGVGNGQYWEVWAKKNGLASYTPFGVAVAGPHNGFLAAWIYFGLPGLALLCLICFAVARQCPGRDNNSWEPTALLGLSTLALVWLLFTHNLYLKCFGLILGLLMGASRGGLAEELDPERARLL